MKIPNLTYPLTAKLVVLSAALAAFVNTSQAQVTFNQVTNGLVSWYPLDFAVTNGSTITTPDFLNGRDMILSPAMTGNNVIASTRPSLNSATVSNCFNLNQAGGATVIYYNSKGQDPLTGGGDFLPFCNQVNATMNFWIKGNAVGGDTRFFGECDTTGGQANPLYLWGDHSSAPGRAHLLFRQEQGDGPGGSIPLVDGTYELPVPGYFMQQSDTYTAAPILDNTWHMFTITIDSNRSVSVYVDGVLDPGAGTGAWTDLYGNLATCQPFPMTNYYYTTNIYPAAGVANPPPNGFVRWMFNATFKTGSTTFGGFKRGGITGGMPCQFDDIAFWNRALAADEIEFVRTNGLTGIPISRPLQINSWTADFAEVGKGDFVTLSWDVTGADTNAGGILISGVGDVSSKGLSGSTNVTLNSAQQTFTLTVHNGIAPDTNAAVTVKSFAGVSSSWHLIQRFDGVFADSINDPLGGVIGNGWVSAGSDFTGSFDKWNVCTIVNSGASNKVMSPRTGYGAVGSIVAYESRGALAYAKLGSLSLSPGKTNTLFFRFSLQQPAQESLVGLYSDMDFGVGLSDYNFNGPSGGLGYYGGTGGGLGPYFSILRNDNGNFGTTNDGFVPFNLFAPDRNEGGTTTNTFNYTTLNPAGLETNVNYLVWMDVENYNTQGVIDGDVTNTINQAVYSVWLQKQGEPNRTQLVNRFRGNRDYAAFNPVNDNPTPVLDKVFFNIGGQSINGAAAGAYFATNMIVVDDIYLSKSGVNATVPRLFDITSIVKNLGNVSLTWNSLGSLYGTNTYTIQRAGLITGPWTSLATIPSGGSTTTYTDNTIGSSDAAFYRIVW